MNLKKYLSYKVILGISLISMSIGMVGCGTDNGSTTSQAPQNTMTTTPHQISRRTTGNNSMTTGNRTSTRNAQAQVGTNDIGADGNYNATQNGEVLGQRGSLLATENETTTGTNNNSSDVSRIEKIEKELSKLEGYKDVTCMVNGDTAIVGCIPTNETKNADQTKAEITNVVKKCDGNITNCEVVQTQDGVTRIRQMVDSLKSGNLGSTISNDFKTMINDLMK